MVREWLMMQWLRVIGRRCGGSRAVDHVTEIITSNEGPRLTDEGKWFLRKHIVLVGHATSVALHACNVFGSKGNSNIVPGRLTSCKRKHYNFAMGQYNISGHVVLCPVMYLEPTRKRPRKYANGSLV